MTTEHTTPHLLRALRRVLYPLARFMLKHGVSYSQLTELLKVVFVDVAEREFSMDNKPQTDSRISLLTGIHRKDVKRLREMPISNEDIAAKSIPLSAQVLAGWLTQPGYQDDHGKPLPLMRTAEAENLPSFDALVSFFSKDIRPRALLDEWARQGMICLDADERIHLNASAFVPQAGFEDKLYYYGHNLHDHLAAATHNLCEVGAPFLERSVHYARLSPEDIAELNALAERRGMAVLYELNALAAKLSQRESAEIADAERFTFGLYFYKAPSESNP